MHFSYNRDPARDILCVEGEACGEKVVAGWRLINSCYLYFFFDVNFSFWHMIENMKI